MIQLCILCIYIYIYIIYIYIYVILRVIVWWLFQRNTKKETTFLGFPEFETRPYPWLPLDQPIWKVLVLPTYQKVCVETVIKGLPLFGSHSFGQRLPTTKSAESTMDCRNPRRSPQRSEFPSRHAKGKKVPWLLLTPLQKVGKPLDFLKS